MKKTFNQKQREFIFFVFTRMYLISQLASQPTMATPTDALVQYTVTGERVPMDLEDMYLQSKAVLEYFGRNRSMYSGGDKSENPTVLPPFAADDPEKDKTYAMDALLPATGFSTTRRPGEVHGADKKPGSNEEPVEFTVTGEYELMASYPVEAERGTQGTQVQNTCACRVVRERHQHIACSVQG